MQRRSRFKEIVKAKVRARKLRACSTSRQRRVLELKYELSDLGYRARIEKKSDHIIVKVSSIDSNDVRAKFCSKCENNETDWHGESCSTCIAKIEPSNFKRKEK